MKSGGGGFSVGLITGFLRGLLLGGSVETMDSSDPRDSVDLIELVERVDRIDPDDRTDPVDSVDVLVDVFDPVNKVDSVDSVDSVDFSDVYSFVILFGRKYGGMISLRKCTASGCKEIEISLRRSARGELTSDISLYLLSLDEISSPCNGC